MQASVMVDHGISPLIPRGGADIVLGLEPVETARALPQMSSKTVVVMNTAPVFPYVLSQRYVLKQEHHQYPDLDELIGIITATAPTLYALDATKLAQAVGSIKSLGILMLGYLVGSGEFPLSAHEFVETAIQNLPPNARDANERAFLRGVREGRSTDRVGRESRC